MSDIPPNLDADHVALRKESVDRNVFLTLTVRNVPVALRKESVDRNTQRRDFKALGLPVALRKESVDRNCVKLQLPLTMLLSLSARRAWIEIHTILGGF